LPADREHDQPAAMNNMHKRQLAALLADSERGGAPHTACGL